MRQINLSGRHLVTDRPAFIMGIVNATPDSFYGESRGGLDRALQLIDEGSDILDIGGESTRPGASYVDADEETRRVVSVVEQLRKFSDIPISIDTRKRCVMEAAWNSGADVLNDISSFEDDESLVSFVADKGLSVILMHKRGVPANMQNDTSYSDVVSQVDSYLENRADYSKSRGISPDKIIVDPGIGFGKGLEENKALIWNCGKLCSGRYPVLMALSRKSCIGQMLGGECAADSDERLFGTLTADVISVLRGASMLRVHDVKACRNSLDVIKSFSGYAELLG